jgi:serine protease Do
VKTGDVILEYDGKPIGKSSDLPAVVAATPIGKTASLTVLRNGTRVTLDSKVAEVPGEASEASSGTGKDGGDRLGLAVQPLTPALAEQLGVRDKTGLAVAGVRDGSPAGEAGLRAGDVIVEANGKPVKTVDDLRGAMADGKAQAPLLLRIHRKDSSLFVAVSGVQAQG